MKPIKIYTSPFCGYCMAAKRLLKSKGLSFSEINVARDPELRQKMMQEAGGRHTVPQIFFGDVHVGGYDDLAALERKSGIESLLSA